MGRPKRKPELMLVSPKRAREFLETMEENRPMRLNYALQLGKEMQGGTWQENGATIAFEGEPPNHKLIDGQHRLTAIIEMNMSMELLVVWNCEEGSIKTTDQGKSRQVWENLHLSGVSIGKYHQTAINAILNATQDHKAKRTVSEIEEFFTDHEYEIKKVVDTLYEGKAPRGVKSGMVAGGVLLAWMKSKRVGENDVEEFLEIIKSGVTRNRKKDRTIITLRDWLITKPKVPKDKRTLLVAYFVHAFASQRALTLVKPMVMKPSFI